jgi:hypothetical protein
MIITIVSMIITIVSMIITIVSMIITMAISRYLGYRVWGRVFNSLGPLECSYK